MEKSKLGVALTNLVCPICGKVCDNQIIMNTKLTYKEADKVRELHGQNVGFSEKPCEECSEAMKEAVMFIVVDASKTTDMKFPYRTGELFGIRYSKVEEMGLDKEILEKRVCYIDYNHAKAMGLPTKYGS
jgi:formylmethanofuran dehydrogenase subunit B